MTELLIGIVFALFSAVAIVSAIRVFRTDSMVRAAFYLLASFAATGAIIVLLGSEFLGMVLILMMAGEMLVMAIVMVMYMMNPAGLNPMVMVHQNRTSVIAGVIAFLVLAGVGLSGELPQRPAPNPRAATADLGAELLGNSMLVFQTAGVTLLATMIGAIAISTPRGRYGSAEAGSDEPGLQPDEEEGA